MRQPEQPDYDAVNLALALRACGLRIWVYADDQIGRRSIEGLVWSMRPSDPAIDVDIDACLSAFDGWCWRTRLAECVTSRSRMDRPGVITGRHGRVVVVEHTGTAGVASAQSDRHLPPSPMTLREAGGRIGDSIRHPRELRLYRCPSAPTSSTYLFTRGSGDEVGRVYGDHSVVRIPTFLAAGDKQTAALDQVLTWPDISELPRFDPDWFDRLRHGR
jgi:hypothetical protein